MIVSFNLKEGLGSCYLQTPKKALKIHELTIDKGEKEMVHTVCISQILKIYTDNDPYALRPSRLEIDTKASKSHETGIQRSCKKAQIFRSLDFCKSLVDVMPRRRAVLIWQLSFMGKDGSSHMTKPTIPLWP